MQRIFQK